MCGSVETGKCDVCGKEGVLTRTYFCYPNVKCECHLPCHFEMVVHHKECTPKEPLETKVRLSTSMLKNSIDFKWYADDVIGLRPDLTTEQALKVLTYTKEHHDAEVGVNWCVLKENADFLFPEEPTV